MKEISIDLETLSTRVTASVASIGIVVEDFTTRESAELYVVVSDPDGHIDPKTVRWHKEQAGDTLGSAASSVRLADGLAKVSTFLRAHGATAEGEARIWTHATFDVPILGEAFARTGNRPPWHYRNCRDLRTLYDLAGGRPTLLRTGTAHNALDDARYQLEEIRTCLSRIEEMRDKAWKYQDLCA